MTVGLSPHLLSCRLHWVFIKVVSGYLIFQTLIGITTTNHRCSTRQVLISTTGIPNRAGAFQGSSPHVWLRFISERMQTKSNRLRETLKSPRLVKGERLVGHQVEIPPRLQLIDSLHGWMDATGSGRRAPLVNDLALT